MTDELYDLEIEPGATEEIEVQPATLISGETHGVILIKSNNGKNLFESDQTRDDAFAIITTSPTLKVKNAGNTTATVKVYGISE